MVTIRHLSARVLSGSKRRAFARSNSNSARTQTRPRSRRCSNWSVPTDKVETKIGRYDAATGTWGFVHYPLEPEPDGGWIGLSELTRLPDGTFAGG